MEQINCKTHRSHDACPIDSGGGGLNRCSVDCDFVGNKTKTKMKKLLILTSLVAICAASNAQIGKPVKPAPAKKDAATAKQTASWIDSITVAPVAALKTEHLDGPSQFGAGIDIGKDINPFVSFHVLNLAFEGSGQDTVGVKKHGKRTGETLTVGEDRWHGAAVDETDLQVDAKIGKFSNESFSLHVVSGGQVDWNDYDYGINAGLRLQYKLGKKYSAGIGYSIRTWFKGETRVDSLATAQIGYRF